MMEDNVEKVELSEELIWTMVQDGANILNSLDVVANDDFDAFKSNVINEYISTTGYKVVEIVGFEDMEMSDMERLQASLCLTKALNRWREVDIE